MVVVRADLVVLALRQLLVGLNQLLGVLVNLGLDESGAAPLDLVLEREMEGRLELPFLRGLAVRIVDRDRVEEDEDGQEQPEALWEAEPGGGTWSARLLASGGPPSCDALFAGPSRRHWTGCRS